jgi:hypothetical protein
VLHPIGTFPLYLARRSRANSQNVRASRKPDANGIAFEIAVVTPSGAVSGGIVTGERWLLGSGSPLPGSRMTADAGKAATPEPTQNSPAGERMGGRAL